MKRNDNDPRECSADMRAVSVMLTTCYLGTLLIAGSASGVCVIGLGDDDAELVVELRRRLPQIELLPADDRLRMWAEEIVAWLDVPARALTVPLDIRGTDFQRRVWQALRSIPVGSTRSYAEIAAGIGQPTAARAVARACAANPLALVIPCHRVVRSDGGPGGYHWGVYRKRALLAREGRAESDKEAVVTTSMVELPYAPTPSSSASLACRAQTR